MSGRGRRSGTDKEIEEGSCLCVPQVGEGNLIAIVLFTKISNVQEELLEWKRCLAEE